LAKSYFDNFVDKIEEEYLNDLLVDGMKQGTGAMHLNLY
jgi:hypothetical protein